MRSGTSWADNLSDSRSTHLKRSCRAPVGGRYDELLAAIDAEQDRRPDKPYVFALIFDHSALCARLAAW